MKKKILSFLIAICMVLPFGFALTACGGHEHTASKDYSCDDTYHWKVCTDEDCGEKLDKEEHDFEEETIEATIDEEGKTIKTCSVCGKEIETTIPKVVQTKAEMIGALKEAVKLSNYEGSIQEVYTNKANTKTYVSVSETEVVDVEYNIRKEDGTAVYYYKSSDKPGTYTDAEYIPNGTLIKKVGNDWLQYSVNENDGSTKTELNSIKKVGVGYSKGSFLSNVEGNLDYLLVIEDEETMTTVLQNTLAGYLPMYQSMFAGYYNDVFTYEVEDIEVDYDVVYENGEYKATGTIELTEITHTNPGATQKVNDFKVEFEVIYTKDMVIKNYSKLVYHIDTTPNEAGDELAEIYIINEDTYSKTIDDLHFTKIEGIVSAYNGVELTPVAIQEEIRIHVNGKYFASTSTDFGTKINTAVDAWVETYLTANDIDDYSVIRIYLDKNNTTAYQSNVDVIVTDYYGTDVYVDINVNNGYSLIITNYRGYFTDVDYEYNMLSKLEIVEINGGMYTMEYTFGGNEHDDKVLVNGNVAVGASFEVVLDEYYIELYYYSTAM